MRILGVDPGSRITGYGIIEATGRQYHCVHWGRLVLDCEAPCFAARLQQIFVGLSAVIQQHQPEVMGIEAVFIGQNAQSALKLGQARGAAMVAGTQAGLIVHEYAARQIKQAVTGSGAADKTQMQKMVALTLALSEIPPPDAADALAIALCHAYTQQSPLRGLLAAPLAGLAATRRRRVRFA